MPDMMDPDAFKKQLPENDDEEYAERVKADELEAERFAAMFDHQNERSSIRPLTPDEERQARGRMNHAAAHPAVKPEQLAEVKDIGDRLNIPSEFNGRTQQEEEFSTTDVPAHQVSVIPWAKTNNLKWYADYGWLTDGEFYAATHHDDVADGFRTVQGHIQQGLFDAAQEASRPTQEQLPPSATFTVYADEPNIGILDNDATIDGRQFLKGTRVQLINSRKQFEPHRDRIVTATGEVWIVRAEAENLFHGSASMKIAPGDLIVFEEHYRRVDTVMWTLTGIEFTLRPSEDTEKEFRALYIDGVTSQAEQHDIPSPQVRDGIEEDVRSDNQPDPVTPTSFDRVEFRHASGVWQGLKLPDHEFTSNMNFPIEPNDYFYVLPDHIAYTAVNVQRTPWSLKFGGILQDGVTSQGQQRLTDEEEIRLADERQRARATALTTPTPDDSTSTPDSQNDSTHEALSTESSTGYTDSVHTSPRPPQKSPKAPMGEGPSPFDALFNALQPSQLVYPRLIGLGGLKQHGKDATADYLADQHNFVKVGMSNALHEALMTLNPIIYEEAVDVIAGHELGGKYRYSDVMNEYGYDKAKEEFPEVRRLQQIFGTEIGRALDEDIWVKAAERRMLEAFDQQSPVAITGIRYRNELALIKRYGGFTVWVNRPQLGAQGDSHSSENSLAAEDFDYVLVNDGDLDALHRKIRGIMGNIDRR